METPSPALRDLARRLLAAEAANRGDSNLSAVENVCEKLRASLTRFTGADGFLALTRRSLTLARREAASLDAVNVSAEGCFEGFDEIAAAGGDADSAKVVLIANFLLLLITFVGEAFAFQLIGDEWPKVLIETEG